MESIAINNCLTLSDSENQPLLIQAMNLSVTRNQGEITDCRLRFEVSSEVYEQIDRQALFNLEPALRISLLETAFDSDRPLQIEARLDEDVLVLLSAHVTSAQAAVELLLDRNQTQPDSLLLSSKSWLGLSVVQTSIVPIEQTIKLQAGYITLWAADLEMRESTTTATTALQSCLHSSISTLEMMGETLAEMDVDVEFDPAQSQLHFTFEGEVWQWDGYASVLEDQQCNLFSVCPAFVPTDNRLVMAEALTRINSQIGFGNFEMNFDDGEVRYRTSLHCTQSSQVGAHLVTMYQYLPALCMIIQGEASPLEAIALTAR